MLKSIGVSLILVISFPAAIYSEGNVGCMYSQNLCFNGEWCFDDFAFGRCLEGSNADDVSQYRYNFNGDELKQLRNEVFNLFESGFDWNNAYTQCRLQSVLYAIREKVPFDKGNCLYLIHDIESDDDIQTAENSKVHNDPTINRNAIGILKYSPDEDDYPDQNEMYYPENMERSSVRKKQIEVQSDEFLNNNINDAYPRRSVKQKYTPPIMMRRRSIGYPYDSSDVTFIQDENEPYLRDYNDDYQDSNWGSQYKPYIEQDLNNRPIVENYQIRPNPKLQWNSKDLYYPLDQYQDPDLSVDTLDPVSKLLKPNIDTSKFSPNSLRDLLWKYSNHNDFDPADDTKKRTSEVMNFHRPERVDVKKPGPPYLPHSHTTPSSSSGNEEHSVPEKKDPRGARPIPAASQSLYVNTDYVYVVFENSLQTWKEGEHIIRTIAKLLHLEPASFSYGRVDRNEVTFKVVPNSRGWNSTEIARRIADIKTQLQKNTGVTVTAAGIGDRTKLESVVSVPIHDDDSQQFFVIMFLLGGVVLAVFMAVIVLLIIRNVIRTRDKKQKFKQTDSEAISGPANKNRTPANVKTAHEPTGGRITSLSRESEQSPSSRSSTSSWTEEPVLHNMDISTGHMVLSYMEDHLKNKDRLEQEWMALCAYAAEPCAMKTAIKKNNVGKNRVGDILPYDHSRIVLNEMSNASGSDYINASTITDHDPRNPAYIATQGPLPGTVSDFWQMVWEQGSVVIVMLTKLVETDNAAAPECHRYWPEEGSHVYHIYEVHLVSEHIWCEDYLVRSFYLKNTRTGETRTVTQFHFLSWPEDGVPLSTKALLEFRRKVNKSYRGRSCPIVVHCSDGVGRTGTYCLIDMVLSRMAKGAKEIDIAATLEHLRDQRMKMVANRVQFEFVLTAVAEEVHAILKALPSQPSTSSAP